MKRTTTWDFGSPVRPPQQPESRISRNARECLRVSMKRVPAYHRERGYQRDRHGSRRPGVSSRWRKPRAYLLPLLALLPLSGAGQAVAAEACSFVPGQGPEMVVIDSGRFQMGSAPDEAGRDDDEQLHDVSILRPFALARCEVSVAEFRFFIEKSGYSSTTEEGDGCFVWDREKAASVKLKGSNWLSPGYELNQLQPVVCVSWPDAVAYAGWLSQQTGQGYRLPSEAEWEYAARAGTGTRYSWGDDIDCGRARYGFFSDDCGQQAHPDATASYPPNPWGLHDMHGNVWEWTQDCWHANYEGAPADGSAWQEGGDCVRRVVRGGGWGSGPQSLRSANRGRGSTGGADGDRGFRLARTL